MGSYVKFLAKLWRKEKLLLEDLPRATEYLELYIKHRETLNYDILRAESLSDLGKAIRPYLHLKSGAVTPFIADLDEDDYKLLYENDEWRIYQPLSEKAACVLGYGTEWCTSYGRFSLNPNYKNRTNLFNSYKKRLLTFISQETDKPVWQISLEHDQFMDIHDRSHYPNFVDYFTDDVFPIIFPWMKDLTKEENVVKMLKYVNHLPDGLRREVSDTINKYIPAEVGKSLLILEDVTTPEEDRKQILLELLNLSQDNKEYIELDTRQKGAFIGFDRKLYTRQLNHYHELIDYVTYASRYSGGNFNDSYGEDVQIDSIFNEDEIFNGELLVKLKRIGLELYSLQDLQDYLGDEDKYMKILNHFTEEYNSAYDEQINQIASHICNKTTKLIKIDTSYSAQDALELELDEFIYTIKSMYVEQGEHYNFEITFQKVIDNFIDNNDIPCDQSDLFDKVQKDFDFEGSAVLDSVQTKIFDMVEERKEEIDEEKESVKKRQKQIEAGIDKVEQETLRRLDIVLNELGISDYHFEDETHDIQIYPNKFDDDGKRVYVEIFYKKAPLPHQNDGYASPEDLQKELPALLAKSLPVKENKYIKTFEELE